MLPFLIKTIKHLLYGTATSNDEWIGLKSQFVISSWGGVRKLPYAFTEMGVAMLSSVLRSSVAIGVNQSVVGRTTNETRKGGETTESHWFYQTETVICCNYPI